MSAVSPYDRNNIALFQPNQVAGLALWLDAADSTTITTSGANVTQWRDKSSNAHICISNANYVGTTLPTYNSNTTYKYVNFADNQALVTSSNWNYSPSWSCFVALNSVSLGARWLISPHNGSTPVLMGMNTGTPQNSSKIWINGFTTAPADITGNHIEYTSAENTNASSNLLWYRDGVIQASNVKTLGSGSGTMKMGIGANGTLGNNMAGTYQLYEVLIFNSYLSTTQRQQIESYLAYKWNLQSSLPTTHPYYNSPYNAYPPFTNINQTIKFAYPVVPSDIGGLALWLDAADIKTITQVNGAVSQWNDKSGSNNDATQVTVGNRPTYINSFIYLNGTTQFFNVNLDFLAGVSHNSFIVINNLNYTNIYGAANGAQGQGSLHVGFQNSVTYRMNYWSNDWYAPITANYKVNQTNILNYNWVNNTSKIIYANGSLEGSNAQPGTIGPMSGGGRIGNVANSTGAFNPAFLNANIYEILMYTGTITVSQRQAIEGYLAYKWNLQTFLPSTHPYYNNPITPTILQSIPNAITMYQFSPRSLSGLALWLDAADFTTVIRTGANVTAWNDKSGNGRNATTIGTDMTYVIAGLKTLNTIQGPQGTATNASGFTTPSFTISTTNSTSIFVVYNQLVVPTSVTFVDSYFIIMPTATNLNVFTRTATGDSFTYYYSRVNGTTGGGGYTPSIPYSSIFEFVYTPNTGTLYGNGTSYNTITTTGGGNAALNNPAVLTLFSGAMQGNICELLIFGTALTTNQRQQIEGYLAWKWGLQANLPSTHPYKLYPPS